MKLRKTLAAAGALAIAGGLTVVSSPAQAACDTTANPNCEGSTSVEFTVSAGGLAISTPAGPVTLAKLGGGAILPGDTVEASLGNTTVTDSRGGLTANWSSYARSAGFVNGTDTIEASKATISTLTGTVTAALGGAVYTTAGPVALATTDVETGDMVLTVLGSQSTTFNPTLSVAIPADAITGKYSGTVVQSAY